MIEAIDMQARALSRLAHQYQESPNLKAILALFVAECVVLRDAVLTLSKLRDIDDSEGDGLDGIGQILGQPRELSGVVPLDFFEFHDNPLTTGDASHGFGDLTDPSQGRRFRSINESPSANRLLGDSEYRAMLRAKILRNQSDATPEDIIAGIQAALPDNPAVHLTFGDGSVTATVQRVLSSEEDSILNAKAGIRGQIPVIPRPTGVDLSVVGL